MAIMETDYLGLVREMAMMEITPDMLTHEKYNTSELLLSRQSDSCLEPGPLSPRRWGCKQLVEETNFELIQLDTHSKSMF